MTASSPCCFNFSLFLSLYNDQSSYAVAAAVTARAIGPKFAITNLIAVPNAVVAVAAVAAAPASACNAVAANALAPANSASAIARIRVL